MWKTDKNYSQAKFNYCKEAVSGPNGIYSTMGMGYYSFARMTADSPTAKLLLTIMANPGKTKREIQQYVYNGDKKKVHRSYMSSAWRFFLAYGLIAKIREGKTFKYVINSFGIEAIYKILINTAKKQFTF